MYTHACGRRREALGGERGGRGSKGAQQVLSPQLVGLAPPQNFLALKPKPKPKAAPDSRECVRV